MFRKNSKGEATSKTFDVTLKRTTGALGLSVTLHSTRIISITKGSVAANAGLRPFDRVVALNGAPLAGTLGDMLAKVQGSSIKLSIERPAESELPKIASDEHSAVCEAQSREPAPQKASGSGSGDSFNLGLETHTLTLLRSDNPFDGLKLGPDNHVGPLRIRRGGKESRRWGGVVCERSAVDTREEWMEDSLFNTA